MSGRHITAGPHRGNDGGVGGERATICPRQRADALLPGLWDTAGLATGDCGREVAIGAPATIWKPTLDCADVEVSTSFWTWLLGLEVILADSTNGIRFLGPADGPPVLCLQPVDEPRSGKNRMHLDLLVDDLEAVVKQVEQRGGAHLTGPNVIPGGCWSVMADPEGNEFCLVMLSTDATPAD